MTKLPILKDGWNHSPHIVLLGAGASRATCPNGDVNGKALPLMNDLIDILDLSKLLRTENIIFNNNNFEKIYDNLVSNDKYQMLTKNIEQIVHNYFSEIELPKYPTIYDYLILSLREKDIIVTFNWDPLLAQAYRRNIKINKLPRLVFLHGNVGIGACYDDKTVGYIDTLCGKCNKLFSPIKLLYPIRKKNYNSDIFIKNEWDILRHYLKFGYYFTIFGYSAPIYDIEAKNLMLEVWKANQTLELTQIEIIDTKPREKLEDGWQEFFVRDHYSIHNDFSDSQLYRYPRRSCDAFAAATLMLSPMHENKFPKFDTLEQLHEWITPLIEEENENKKLSYPTE